MDKISRMKELIKLVDKYNYAYYTLDAPLISDKEYDDLYYGVTLTRCYDGIKYFYECSETNTSYDYWRPVDSYSCSYGWDAYGVDCY